MSPPRGVFIAGTDTDVGKTLVSAGLVRFLRHLKRPTVGVKPVCCGSRADVEVLYEAGQGALERELLNPIYLEEPAAPLASRSKAPVATLCEIVEQVRSLEQQHSPLIVEGAGGWCVPVDPEWGMDDLARELDYPVVLVVANRLGALNHTLLTVRVVESMGLRVAGYFLNTIQPSPYQLAQETNRAVLESLLEIPCFGEIPVGGGSLCARRFCQELGIETQGELPDLAFAIPLRE